MDPLASLITIPVELRLQIYNYILESIFSYSTIYQDEAARNMTAARPGPLLYVNRQISAEYSSCFYAKYIAHIFPRTLPLHKQLPINPNPHVTKLHFIEPLEVGTTPTEALHEISRRLSRKGEVVANVLWEILESWIEPVTKAFPNLKQANLILCIQYKHQRLGSEARKFRVQLGLQKGGNSQYDGIDSPGIVDLKAHVAADEQSAFGVRAVWVDYEQLVRTFTTPMLRSLLEKWLKVSRERDLGWYLDDFNWNGEGQQR